MQEVPGNGREQVKYILQNYPERFRKFETLLLQKLDEEKVGMLVA